MTKYKAVEEAGKLASKQVATAREAAFRKAASRRAKTSGWKTGLPPKTYKEMFLVRHEEWDCPCVVIWTSFEDSGVYLGFAEAVLIDICGSVDEDMYPGMEWAPLPA